MVHLLWIPLCFMHNTAWRGWPVSLANSSVHDAQVLRDFKLPEGASGDDIDANGDGEVLAVLDLGIDESLVEAGLAREVVNRVQKLRKKAGLVASDIVDVFLSTHHQHPGGILSHSMSVLEYTPISDNLSFCKCTHRCLVTCIAMLMMGSPLVAQMLLGSMGASAGTKNQGCIC